MKYFALLIWGAALLLSSCSDESGQGIDIIPGNYDFAENGHNWMVDFASYRVPQSTEDSARYNFVSEYTALPSNVGSRRALKISGNNVDGQLFMYMQKIVTGLQPDTDYIMALEIELASSARQDKPEGTAVHLVAGAFNTEPKKVIQQNFYTLNIDVSYSAVDGNGSMMLLGNIATDATSNDITEEYALLKFKTNTTNPPYHVRSNEYGEIWLVVGTDSRYSGTTTVYYNRVSYVLSASK